MKSEEKDADHSVTIYKLNEKGEEVWRWEGRVLAHGETWIQVEAHFNAGEVDMGFVTFCEGDRFVEWYYGDRWYNIFEIHAHKDDAIKGWYCNITRPARIEGGAIWHEDLALDLFVHPDGRTLLLDEDEFEALAIAPAERRAACAALEALRADVRARRPPFAQIR